MSPTRPPRSTDTSSGKPSSAATGSTRRDFVKTSAVLTAAALLAPGGVVAQGSDTIRVGLVGCGGRGTGAAANCAQSADGVHITAMADLFGDRLQDSRQRLQQNIAGAMHVSDDRCFVGFDAYQKVMQSDVDLVILATPPAFRPRMLEAAIGAGKNVFMEKPVAVDATGIRRVIAAGALAKQKGLAIVSGTQRRHQASYMEIMRRVREGAIGEVVGGQCYWNQGGLWVRERRPEYSDVEWQIRNWLYFTWLSGDHIVEQHIHNLDVMNWAFGGPPVSCMGMGGRQVRTDSKYGNIFDHFAIEYVYDNGSRMMSMCRQIDGCANRVGEQLVGSLGTCNPGRWIKGPNEFQYSDKVPDPYVQEHSDLIRSMRSNDPLNEATRVAESTLTAIMGRMSAYTGKPVTWEQAMNSQLDLVPEPLVFGPKAIAPVSVPGQTPLV